MGRPYRFSDMASQHKNKRVQRAVAKGSRASERVQESDECDRSSEGDVKSWDHSIQYVRSSPMQTDALMIQESSIAVRYRDMYSEFGRETLLYTNWMMKRFVETDREVQVWRKMIMGEHNQGVDQAAFVEMVGWVVHLPAELGVIIRHCVHPVPKFLDEEYDADASCDYPHVGDLVGSALGSLQTDLTQVTAQMSTS